MSESPPGAVGCRDSGNHDSPDRDNVVAPLRSAAHGTRHPTPGRPGRAAGWVFMAAMAVFAVTQAHVLVRRARAGQSDFGVLYRTAREMNAGAGPEVYAPPKAEANWPRCIPPFGMLMFRPLALMDPGPAAVVWSAVNLLLLAGGVLCLVALTRRVGPWAGAYRRSLPWAAGVLFLLSAGSLQTGQFTAMFAVCCLAFMLAVARGMRLTAALALAVPISIKFYHMLIAAVPLAMRDRRQLLLLVPAVLLLSVGVAFCGFGPRLGPLSVGYVRHNFLAENNAVNVRFKAHKLPNQAIDVVLLRYLTDVPGLQAATPHLNLSRYTVLALAMALRAAIVLAAGWASWWWVKHRKVTPAQAAVMLTAWWSATLYLILPEHKGRYCAYVFPAYLPILAAAAEAWAARSGRRFLAWAALSVVATVCLIELPRYLLSFGVGLVGPAGLWAGVLICMRRRPIHADPVETALTTTREWPGSAQ